MTVIIADDEELIRYELKAIISDLLPGVTVREAENGRQLIELCRAEPPDIAFVDIKMPGVSGIDAIEQLSGMDISTNFVILSGHREFELARQAIRLGVIEYLLKPVDPHEIEALLICASSSTQSNTAGADFPAADSSPEHGGAGSAPGARSISPDTGATRSLVTIRQAERLIRQHYQLHIGVNEIAEMLGITPNYLSSLYKRVRGSSLTAFITELRMERARQLLLEPGARVSKVAEQLGYSSSRHFSRLFHDQFHVSPSDFIAQNA